MTKLLAWAWLMLVVIACAATFIILALHFWKISLVLLLFMGGIWLTGVCINVVSS